MTSPSQHRPPFASISKGGPEFDPNLGAGIAARLSPLNPSVCPYQAKQLPWEESQRRASLENFLSTTTQFSTREEVYLNPENVKGL